MFYGPSWVYSYLISKCPFSKSEWFLKYLDHYRQQLFKSQMDKHHFALETQISHGSVKFYVILFSLIFYFLILYIYLVLVCCYCFWIKLWVSNFFLLMFCLYLLPSVEGTSVGAWSWIKFGCKLQLNVYSCYLELNWSSLNLSCSLAVSRRL